MSEFSKWYVTVRPPDANFPKLMNKKQVSWYVFGNGGSQDTINQLIEYMGFGTTAMSLPGHSTTRFVKSKIDEWLAKEEGV
ncbi:MAG: hypothetical protein L0G20_08200 [Lactobacillus sp.]|nr:hypothetical protein [Lactobacillus sp.]